MIAKTMRVIKAIIPMNNGLFDFQRRFIFVDNDTLALGVSIGYFIFIINYKGVEEYVFLIQISISKDLIDFLSFSLINSQFKFGNLMIFRFGVFSFQSR